MSDNQTAIKTIRKRIVITNDVKTIHGNIDLANLNLTKLPDLADVDLYGNLICYNNKLSSLIGCPKTVDGWVNCSHNQLTSLKGCAKEITEDFDCSHNKLTSLKYCPNHINGHFICNNNQLTALKYIPAYLGGGLDCSNNKIKSLQYAPKYINNIFYGGNNPWSPSLKVLSEMTSTEYNDLLKEIKETQEYLAYFKANPISITAINIEI